MTNCATAAVSVVYTQHILKQRIFESLAVVTAPVFVFLLNCFHSFWSCQFL